MADFSFNPGSQRFQYTSGDKKGQFVSKQDLDGLVGSYVEQQTETVQKITQRMLNKRMGVNNWIREIAAELKPAHINAYMIGKGGKAQMDSRDYGILGAMLKEEYKYLRQFGRDILDKKLSKAQIRSRVNLYVNSYYGSFERGRQEGHSSNGYRWERRIRNAAESCGDCIGYAAQGWQSIGSLPANGEQCACRSNCRCTKEYSGSQTRPTNNFLEIKDGWIGMNAIDTVIDQLAETIAQSIKGLDREALQQKIIDLSADDRTKLETLVQEQAEPISLSPMSPDGEDDDDDDEDDDEYDEPEVVLLSVDGLYMGQPTDEDADVISTYTGQKCKKEDWFMFAACVSDNAIQLSWPCAWHLNVLQGIAEQMPGKPVLFNHSDYDVAQSKGFWLRTVATRDMAPPMADIDVFGNLELNRHRMRDTGLVKVYAMGAIHVSEEETIEAIKARRLQDVSTGSLIKDIYHICPHCSEKYGREVEAYEKNANGEYVCPHAIPTPYMKMLDAMGMFEEEVDFMDYAIINSGAQYHFETSAVNVGNLPNAEILRY